jgi:trans-aconitate methyltransferase
MKEANWNPKDYARNSSAQLVWARELISRMSFVGSEAVLDVGCGDGKISAEFARALPRGYVLGVDSSPEFIAHASVHYPKALFSSLQFEVMDARSLNTNRRFDLVFSNAAMHWVDDHPAFLRGAAKHLCIEGRLVLSCGGAGNASGIIAALEKVTSSSAWQRYFHGFHFPYYFYSPSDYSVWLPEANLTPVRCELVEKDMIHDSPEGLAGWFRTTWLPYTQQLPEELRTRFVNELVSQYLEDNPMDESGRTHVHMIRLEVEAVKVR